MFPDKIVSSEIVEIWRLLLNILLVSLLVLSAAINYAGIVSGIYSFFRKVFGFRNTIEKIYYKGKIDKLITGLLSDRRGTIFFHCSYLIYLHLDIPGCREVFHVPH